MVGIAGFINDSGEFDTELDDMVKSLVFTNREQIDRLNNQYFGIARVSHGRINSEPQPIFNEDKSLCIVMEGELFNYENSKAQLINRGYKFKYESNDAEYCLHLYEDIGISAFEKLNGSFCIAIYHTATNELLLVNDRFSSYEIYYYLTDDNTLLFGSQLSSILKSSKVEKQLDISSVFEFFTFHRIFGTKTYYKNIKATSPATVLHYRDGDIALSQYWEMRYCAKPNSFKYYVDEFTNAIKESIERRTSGGDKLGVLLSSGYDSRILFAASKKEMVAFTIDDFESKEIDTVKRMAKIKNCNHILLCRDKNIYQRIVDLIDTEVEIGNGMFSLEHFHAIPFIDSIAKECNIISQGNIFGVFFRGSGYPRKAIKIKERKFRIPIIKRLSNNNISNVVLEDYKYTLHPLDPKQLFSDSYASIFNKKLKESIDELLNEANGRTENIYDKYMWPTFHYISRYPSVIFEHSIRHYMDTRDFLYDNDLLDLYLRMPFKMRSIDRGRKMFLMAIKKIHSEISKVPRSETLWRPIASTILFRISQVVQAVVFKVFRIKPRLGVGWISPSKLIRNNESLKKMIWEIIDDEDALDPKIFNIERIKELFKEHLEEKNSYYPFIYSLIVFGKWHKKYGNH